MFTPNELAAELNAATGQDWSVLDGDTWDLTRAGVYSAVRFVSPAYPGGSISVSHQRGQLIATGNNPKEAFGILWVTATPKIGLSATKGVRNVARDIAKRLLPKYGEHLADVQGKLAAKRAEAEGIMATAERVAAVIPDGRVRETYDDVLTGGSANIYSWSAGRVRVSELRVPEPDDVSMKLDHLTGGQAEAILRIVFEAKP